MEKKKKGFTRDWMTLISWGELSVGNLIAERKRDIFEGKGGTSYRGKIDPFFARTGGGGEGFPRKNRGGGR